MLLSHSIAFCFTQMAFVLWESQWSKMNRFWHIRCTELSLASVETYMIPKLKKFSVFFMTYFAVHPWSFGSKRPEKKDMLACWALRGKWVELKAIVGERLSYQCHKSISELWATISNQSINSTHKSVTMNFLKVHKLLLKLTQKLELMK